MSQKEQKVLAIIGSPRRKNTLHLVEVVEEELKKLGPVSVEYVFLAERNIGVCRGCMQCLARGWEFCPLQDDLAGVMASIDASDGVILASPVYIMHVTAQTKTFLDRLPSFFHRPVYFHKQAMAVVTTGGIGVKPTLSYMKSILGVLGFRTVVGVGGVSHDSAGRFSAALEEKARRAARRFYANLSEGDANKPSLSSIIQFRVQRRTFTTRRAAEIFPKDAEHYAALEGMRYPVDAPIGPCRLAVAWAAEKCSKVLMKLM